jgi:hypothetical protein
MYNGDATLRKAGEQIEYTPEMVKEYIKCKEDVLYFAERYFKIVTIDKGEMLIPLWDFQKKMLKSFHNPAPYRHNIVLASRQIGKSTIATIYILWYVLFNPDKTVAILANKEKTAIEILRRIKFAYQNLPLWLQQGVKDAGWNKKSMSLENGTMILADSTASNSVRGFTISLLYLDEFALVPPNVAKDFMDSVFPTIASGQSSRIIIVSTPKGLNHFFHEWRKAVRHESDYKPIKINWWEVPGRDKKWKEQIIRNNGIVHFNCEYNCKFLGSTNTLVDPELLERMETTDPVKTKFGGLLQIWEEPVHGQMYMLGIDSAKGTNNDYSVIQVLKIIDEHRIEQVAMYRCNSISTYDFAQVCIEISNHYNECYMMVENNDVGEAVANTIWYDYECDRIINCDKKGIGIRSTKHSKLAANMLLKRYLESGWMIIRDKTTVFELSRYEEKTPNVFSSGKHENDDTVTALLWGLYFVSTTFFDGKNVDIKKIDDKFRMDKNNDDERTETAMVIDTDGDYDTEEDF